MIRQVLKFTVITFDNESKLNRITKENIIVNKKSVTFLPHFNDYTGNKVTRDFVSFGHVICGSLVFI